MEQDAVFAGIDGSAVSFVLGSDCVDICVVTAEGDDATATLSIEVLGKVRDWINLHVANTPKPKVEVAGDERWEQIKMGHGADPSNEFLASLYQQGDKWNQLTEKQLNAGAAAAQKVLDNG